jgi:hypothetical protein
MEGGLRSKFSAGVEDPTTTKRPITNNRSSEYLPGDDTFGKWTAPCLRWAADEEVFFFMFSQHRYIVLLIRKN